MTTPRTGNTKSTRSRGGRKVKEIPSRKVRRILRSVKAHLEAVYGSGIRQVIVYGSQARGDATRESDVDVAIIIQDGLDPREVERSLDGLLWDVVMDEGELVATVAINETKFKEYKTPFILNVKEEGVII